MIFFDNTVQNLADLIAASRQARRNSGSGPEVLSKLRADHAPDIIDWLRDIDWMASYDLGGIKQMGSVYGSFVLVCTIPAHDPGDMPDIVMKFRPGKEIPEDNVMLPERYAAYSGKNFHVLLVAHERSFDKVLDQARLNGQTIRYRGEDYAPDNQKALIALVRADLEARLDSLGLVNRDANKEANNTFVRVEEVEQGLIEITETGYIDEHCAQSRGLLADLRAMFSNPFGNGQAPGTPG